MCDKFKFILHLCRHIHINYNELSKEIVDYFTGNDLFCLNVTLLGNNALSSDGHEIHSLL